MTSKVFFKCLFLFYKFLLRRLRSSTSTSHATYGSRSHKWPPVEDLSRHTIVCDMEGGLLRTASTFPYFMLVALEAGGFLRGLLLLILHPLISCLSCEVGLRVMVMVCFFGLKKESFRVGKAVLPKFFLECVGVEGFEVLRRGGKRVCVSSMPTAMVEGFVREYLDADLVLGRELKVFGGYYTGLTEEISEGLALEELLGSERLMEDGVIGFGGHACLHHQLFTNCKEVYLVSDAEKTMWRALPRSKYPKPLVFHDGRVAFRPTPISTLSMFLWLPLGFNLAFARALVFIFLPYALSVPLLAFLGMHSRVSSSSAAAAPRNEGQDSGGGGQLYICNHRTLLDPLYISAALGRHVTAATYSVSRVTELISPIRTIRLTRNRAEDKAMMKRLLREGDLVVCPEGTTCREPYLLRFSPLCAEVSQAVAPVGMESWVSMFYGTSTSKLKFLDPLYFLMNSFPYYELDFMAKVATGSIAGKECSSCDMANYLQSEIANRLGFECTSFTRKDKYLILAGNEGIVERDNKVRCT